MQANRIINIDFLGALISTGALLLLLLPFYEWIGMEQRYIIYLGVYAGLIILIHLGRLFLFKISTGRFLNYLILLNVGYLFLSILFLAVEYNSITKYGWTYFAFEIIILIVLVSIEKRATQFPSED